MQTRIYIDGYNFYYGCLKHTSYKWLDLVKLFSTHIIPRSGINRATLHQDIGIKFFTAEISNKVATDSNSVADQRSYHAALSNFCRSELAIVKGSYAIDKTSFPLVEKDVDGNDKEPKDSSTVRVWKLEEKQSDVNIAIEAVYDAITDPSIEQVIFVTNDTDIVPALKKIREFNQTTTRTDIKIGLVIPARENNQNRKPNKSLSVLADWTVRFIKNEELAASQLPCRIPGKRQSAFKPVSWFEYSQSVEQILAILAAPEVLGSIPKAWRWLSEPKPEVAGLPILPDNPSQHMDSQIVLRDILTHVKAFAEYKKQFDQQ